MFKPTAATTAGWKVYLTKKNQQSEKANFF